MVSSLRLGGAERFVIDLARAQRRLGIDASVASLGSDDDVLVPVAAGAGVPTVSLGAARSRLRRATRLFAALLPRGPTVIHVHSPWCLPWLLVPRPIARGAVVMTRHGAHPFSSRRWRALHLACRPFIDHVAFVSAEARDVFERVHGRWKGAHAVVENGADLDVPVRVERQADLPLRVGCVGRLVELKNQRLALDAVGRLPEAEARQIEIHVFGDGPDRDALEEHARRHLGPGQVIFHGAVMDRDAVYRHIDVLAVTSRMEGLSLAIMEAMAREIPVVATDVGGNPRLVVPERTGFLYPRGDVDALSRALLRFVRERPVVSLLGRGGRALVARQFPLSGTAATYRALYGDAPWPRDRTFARMSRREDS